MKRLASLVTLTTAWLLAASVATAAPIVFVTFPIGGAESPPNPSPGSGSAAVIFDPVAHTMQVIVTFSGLIGTTTAAHVHCCTAVPGAGNIGVATELPSFTGFPLGVTSGSYDHTFDTSLDATWSPAFLAANGGAAGAEAAFLAGMFAGTAYLNIHSTFRPAGEIRGFLAVPEPASLALLGVALAGLGFTARARRR